MALWVMNPGMMGLEVTEEMVEMETEVEVEMTEVVMIEVEVGTRW